MKVKLLTLLRKIILIDSLKAEHFLQLIGFMLFELKTKNKIKKKYTVVNLVKFEFMRRKLIFVTLLMKVNMRDLNSKCTSNNECNVNSLLLPSSLKRPKKSPINAGIPILLLVFGHALSFGLMLYGLYESWVVLFNICKLSPSLLFNN